MLKKKGEMGQGIGGEYMLTWKMNTKSAKPIFVVFQKFLLPRGA